MVFISTPLIGSFQAVAKGEKVPRPGIKMEMDEDDFLYFENR